MKTSLKFLFLILISISCKNQPSTSQPPDIEIFCNSKRIEARYIDTLHNITQIVTFDSANSLPIDSVVLFQRKDGEIKDSIKIYNFSAANHKYELIPDTESPYHSLYNYKQYFDTLYLDVLNDMCLEEDLFAVNNILTSPLPAESKPELIVSDSLDFRILKYSGINAIFRNNPLFIQSYFYNQKLYALHVKVKENTLMESNFFFQEGTLNIHYHYKNGMINQKIITCKYNKGIEYIYDYSYKVK